MNGLRAVHSVRARVVAVAVCVVAVVGGALVAAPAHADTPVAASGVTGAGSPDGLAGLSLARSSNTVYPVEDGFEDSVRFAIRARDAAGAAVAVRGTAVLSKRGKPVRTWRLDGTASVIEWNGRVGRRIETGLFTLAVRAGSRDGSIWTATSRVRVLGKHLVRRRLVIRTRIGASATAAMPSHLLKAFAMGAVRVRIRTVATVHGPARLVFTNDGVTRSIPLRQRTHTTKALTIPAGFAHVTITHDWAAGDADLTSLEAIWIHWDLV